MRRFNVLGLTWNKSECLTPSSCFTRDIYFRGPIYQIFFFAGLNNNIYVNDSWENDENDEWIKVIGEVDETYGGTEIAGV